MTAVSLGAERKRSKVAQGHRDRTRGTGYAARGLAAMAGGSPVTYQRRLQRFREMLGEVVAWVEADNSPEARQWLATLLTDALSTLAGPRLPFTATQLAQLAAIDGAEDGALARLIAEPHSAARIREWVRAAEAEQASRTDLIAAAHAHLGGLNAMG